MTHVAFVSLLALATPTLALAAWPAYRGPQGNGSTQERIVKTTWPAAGPKKLWSAETPTGFSSFAVADGRAFTLVKRDIDGVPTEVCLALDASTGKEIWATPLKLARYDRGGDEGTADNQGGDGPRSTPTVAGGRVFVMGASLDLHALDAATGKPVWTKDLIAEHNGRNIRWHNAASPLLEDGLLYVAGGGEGQALLAIEADSGKVVWKGQNDQMTHATPVAATIHGVRQIVFFTQSGLVSVAPKDGKALWRYNFPYRISTAASPVVHNDMVYCAAGYGVGMGCAKIIKKGDGFEAEEVWRKEGDRVTNHWSSPVVKDGHLYGMFSFKKYGKGPVTCLELATGEVKWSQEGLGAGNLILTGGDTLLALSDKGELVLIAASPDKYKELARADVLDGKCWSTPVLANGTIYARSTKEAVAVDVSK
ncbi:MAG: PQQ-binding-like beta-propeller repeat protein [Verrucomicrobiales bacterium]